MSSPEANFVPDESTGDSDPLHIEEADEGAGSPSAEPSSAVVFVKECSLSSDSSVSQPEGTASPTVVDAQELVGANVRDDPLLTKIDCDTGPPTPEIFEKRLEQWPVLEILPGCVINNSFCEDDHFEKLVDIDMTERPQIDIPTYLKLASHSDMKMWSCAVCDESFHHMRELTDHVKVHKPDWKGKAMPLSAAERKRKYREKLKEKDPEKYEESKRRNAEYWRRRGKTIAQMTELEKNRRREICKKAEVKRKLKKAQLESRVKTINKEKKSYRRKKIKT